MALRILVGWILTLIVAASVAALLAVCEAPTAASPRALLVGSPPAPSGSAATAA